MLRIPMSRERWEGLADKARYSVSELARLCNFSTRQVHRIIRREFGCSAQHWLNQRRLLAAQRSLLLGDSIKKVALDLGFKQSSHFCRKFKSFNRMTPSEFVSLHTQTIECPREITNVAVR